MGSGPILGLGPQISSNIMTNYQHCTRESIAEEAHCRFHKRAIGPTWDPEPKLPQNHKRSLTKHLYDRWSTLLSINWRKRLVVLQYFTKWTLRPILGLGPQISSIIMTNYQQCTRESVVEEAHCGFHKGDIGPTWDLGPKFHQTINRRITKHHYYYSC